MNKPKQIGTACETAVVNALRRLGFPGAERRALHGANDLGDILVTVGVIAEVKGGKAAKTASDAQIEAWLQETERERVNASADVAFLVTPRTGIGPANAHRWWVHIKATDIARFITDIGDLGDSVVSVRLTLEHFTVLLRDAGYGDPKQVSA